LNRRDIVFEIKTVSTICNKNDTLRIHLRIKNGSKQSAWFVANLANDSFALKLNRIQSTCDKMPKFQVLADFGLGETFVSMRAPRCIELRAGKTLERDFRIGHDDLCRGLGIPLDITGMGIGVDIDFAISYWDCGSISELGLQYVVDDSTSGDSVSIRSHSIRFRESGSEADSYNFWINANRLTISGLHIFVR